MSRFFSPFFRRRLVALALVAGFIPALAGCVGAAAVAGAGLGLAALQERGAETVARDTALTAEVISNYVNKNANLAVAIGVEVWESRALLTGQVKTEAERAEAVRLAWQVTGLKDVINEISVESGSGLADLAYDSWISVQLKSRLTLDQNIPSINYDVETVNGVVYLIGIARSQAELDRVLAHARNTKRVRRVISHVRVKQP